MLIIDGHLTAADGRILLSPDENNEDFILNIWDRSYRGSLDVVRVTRDKLIEWNDPNSPLYNYFMRVGGGVTFLELDDILEVK